MTDEYFQNFLDGFGPQIQRREVPLSSIERYRGRLPDQLLEYWKEFGWSGYAMGLFWVVDPQEYEGVLVEWLSGSQFEGKDDFHVIALNAFGDLSIWGEKFGYAFTIASPVSYVVPRQSFTVLPDDMDREVQYFFLTQNRDYEDTYDLFEEAHAELGELEYGQMYGFVPALALGGAVVVENLQKVSAVEHLTFLAQLDELGVLPMPVWVAPVAATE